MANAYMPTTPSNTPALMEMILYFLRIGAIGFGGPVIRAPLGI